MSGLLIDCFAGGGGASKGIELALNRPIDIAVNHITAKDVAAMMGLLKVARIATGNKADSFVDLAGYAACAGEIATAEDLERRL